MKRILILFLLLACSARAADFGDIPANLTLGAGTSVRRNAGDTAFESYTPGSGGGSGTVTDFSAGDLSPLFTTTEATTTTTPALSFSLTNAAAHKFFGNNTGSTAAPDYVSITTADLPVGTGTVTSVGLAGTTNQITITGTSPITTSGSWTASIPTAARLNVAKLTNLTTNGLILTTGLDGTLSIATPGVDYLPGNAIEDLTFGPLWNGITTDAPSKNTVYDYLHIAIPNDDGKVGTLNNASAGMIVASAGGSVNTANFGTGLTYTSGTQTLSLDSDLATIAGLTATTDNFMVAVSSAWSSRTPAQVKTTLGLTDSVLGPASATDNAIVRFDGTTGKLVQDSVITIADTTGVISNAGTAPELTANGAATNIDINLRPKGTGWTQLYANNATNALPASSLGWGLAIGTHYTGGFGEVDFMNQYSASGTNPQFIFYKYDGNALADVGTYGVTIGSTSLYRWSSASGGGSLSSADTGLYRNAAGVVEINNGTPGSYRDLICRHLTVEGVTSTGATGTGQVVFDTSPTIVTPTIAKLSNLNTNGYVKTSGSDGTLSVVTDGSGWTSLWVNGSDFTTSSTTLVDITGLITPTLATSTTYEFQVVLRGSSSATTGCQFGFNVTGTGTPTASYTGTANLTTNTGVNCSNFALNNATIVAWTATASPLVTATMTGMFTTGTGSPVASVQILKVTSGTATVKIGSVFRYRIAGQ